MKPAIQLDKEPAIIVSKPATAMQPAHHDNQLMSKKRVLSLKSQRRLIQIGSATFRPPILDRSGGAGGVRTLVGAGIGLNFSCFRSMPSSSSVVYLTGLRHSPHFSG